MTDNGQAEKEIQEKLKKEKKKRAEKAATRPEKTSVAKEVFDWVLVIVLAIVISFAINTFVIVNATVPTSSMESTIMAGDRVIGSRLYYLRHEPQRGDIIMFDYPDDPSILYIKRIIGVPGDQIVIHDGVVFLNGEELSEPYLNTTTEGIWGPYEVPEGHYFMLGDNRNDSADSRYWRNTYLSRDGIVGKAVFKYWKGFERFNQETK
jgi:signal peptidase I